MSKTTTIVLLAVVIALGAGVFLFEEDETPPSIGESLFPDVVMGDIEELTIKVGDRPEINLQRAAEGSEEWHVLVGGLPVPASPTGVEEVLTELKRCRIEKRIPAGKVDAQSRQDWLLVPEVHWVKFRMRGEERKAVLGLGTLQRDRIYASRSDSEDVLVVEDGLLKAVVELRSGDLRARRLLEWSVYEVDALTIQKGGETLFTAARDPADATVWLASHPYAAHVHPRAMESDLLPGVLGLEADEFPADNVPDEDLEGYGLAPDPFEMVLTGSAGKGIRTILIGRYEEETGRVHYMEKGRPFVYLGKAGSLLTTLAEEPSSWRDRSITRLGWKPVDRIEASLGDTAFTVERIHDEWHLQAPEKAVLDQSAVEDWLGGLRGAEAAEFADEPDLPELGLDEPRGEIALYPPVDPDDEHGGDEGAEEEAEPVLRILIGEGPGDRAGVWLLREGEPGTAYLSGPEFLDLVAGGHYHLKRPAVLDGVELGSSKIIRVERTFRGETVDLTTVDGRWPVGTREPAVSSVVAKLLGLRAVRWVGPADGREEDYGFGEASILRLRVTLREEEGAETVHGVDIGKETEGGRFALAFREGEPEADVFVAEPRMTEPVMERIDPDADPIPVERGLQIPLTDE